MNKYYPLEHGEWTTVRKTLKPVEIVILYHLRTLEPFGDRAIKVNVTELAKELEINRSTASRALKNLGLKGFLKYELNEITVVLNCDRKVTPVIKKSHSEVIKLRSPDRTNSQEMRSKSHTVRSLDHSDTPQNHTGHATDLPHTIQTNKIDQIGSEIENFDSENHEDEAKNSKAIAIQKTKDDAPEKNCNIEISNPGDPKFEEKTGVADQIDLVSEKRLEKADRIVSKLEKQIREAIAEKPIIQKVGPDIAIAPKGYEELFRDFIINTIEKKQNITIENRDRYLNKVLRNDEDLWRTRFAESQKPRCEPKETIIDAWRIESGLISAMLSRDYDHVIQTLINLPQLAEEILTRHPNWRALLCL